MPDLPAAYSWSGPPGGLPYSAGRPIYWGGHSDPLFRIHFGNLALTILTIGIYRFWGIVRIRRYVWSHTAFLGDRLEYAGTGGELLRGFLIVMAILLPMLVLFAALDTVAVAGWWLFGAIAAGKILVFLFLISVGRHAARRYLASRTVWRGLRFAVTGSPWHCGRVIFGWWLLTLLTLGLARPWALAAETRWSFGRLHFGTQPARFGGTGAQLLRPWLASWLLVVLGIAAAALIGLAIMPDLKASLASMNMPTPDPEADVAMFRAMMLLVLYAVILVAFGVALLLPLLLVAWFSFAAAAMRWRWGNLEFGGARFAMPDLGGGRLARLQLGNWFLMIVSFGLLYPLVITRNARFLAERLWTDRPPDVSSARQAALGALNAEGLASALDGGGAIGI